jgi:molybdopterin/thiamine biosynthesis adenylyltransferase
MMTTSPRRDHRSPLQHGAVLVVGVGGLGCPAALALALAGVGRIGLIDPDLVDVSNLQRQILHFTPDLQRPKVESAQQKLSRLRPASRVITYPERLNPDNIGAVFQDYDFVIDATDGTAAKFMINDAAVLLGKPFSYAGIVQFQGQTLTVLPGKTTCLRCLFPVPPAPDEIPSCQEAGVLGSAAGSLGLIQATEAVKYLSGSPGLLTDRLLTYDAQTPRWREVQLKPNPRCPVCGPQPSITSLRPERYEEAGLCQAP